MTPLCILDQAAGSSRKTCLGGLNIAFYEDVALGHYFQSRAEKERYMDEHFDFYLLAGSSLLEDDFYDDEINSDLEHLRWSKGDSVKIAPSWNINPGLYEVVLDVGTKRPAPAPIEPVHVHINNRYCAEIPGNQERCTLTFPYPLDTGEEPFSMTLITHAFQPKQYDISTDERRLGFLFYSLGLRKFQAYPEKKEFYVDLGNTTDDTHFISRGFHGAEHGEVTFRWTNGDAELFLSMGVAMDSGALLEIEAAASNPLKDTCTMTISIDGRSLGSVLVKKEFSVYTVTIPFGLSRGLHRLRLQSTTWNPSRDAGTHDDRDLGISIDWVQISPR